MDLPCPLIPFYPSQEHLSGLSHANSTQQKAVSTQEHVSCILKVILKETAVLKESSCPQRNSHCSSIPCPVSIKGLSKRENSSDYKVKDT
jgi:hypothetical protein